MKNKLLCFMIPVYIALLSGLAWVNFSQRPAPTPGMIVLPQSKGIEAALELLDTLNKEKMALAYELTANKNLRPDGSGYTQEALIIGTNFMYPHVMGMMMKQGSFFTEQAQKQKLPEIVLNQRAAFLFYGSENIVGETIALDGIKFRISGVISDFEKEKPQAYVPGLFLDSPVESIALLLEEAKGFTAEYGLSQLKTLGLTQDNTDFYQVGQINRLPHISLLMALSLTGCGLAIWMLSQMKELWFGAFMAFKRNCAVLYAREWFKERRFYQLLILGLFLLVLALSAAGSLWAVFTLHIDAAGITKDMSEAVNVGYGQMALVICNITRRASVARVLFLSIAGLWMMILGYYGIDGILKQVKKGNPNGGIKTGAHIKDLSQQL